MMVLENGETKGVSEVGMGIGGSGNRAGVLAELRISEIVIGIVNEIGNYIGGEHSPPTDDKYLFFMFSKYQEPRSASML